MSKLTSKIKSTHKIGLGNRRINYLGPVVRQTSGSPGIFAFISKHRPGWFPVGYWFSACTGSYHARLDAACSWYSLLEFLAARRTIPMWPYRFRAENRKNAIHQLWGQKARFGENRDSSLQLHVAEAWFSGRYAADSGVPECKPS